MKDNEIKYVVLQSPQEMWKFMGEKWRDISLSAIGEKRYFSAALSGGNTPTGFYQYLSSLEGLPWDKTHIFLVDERFVPETDPDSNYGMIRERLLDAISINAGNVHPISTADLSLQTSAQRYEEELKAFFGLYTCGIPRFDLILLGIGEDGHTASLFPGTEALETSSRLALAVMLKAPLRNRITLTLPVINNARNVFFLVTGKDKSAVLKKLIDERDHTLPASLVQPVNGRLFFVMDEEARGE